MSLRVAFTLIGGRGWLGGYNYLLNLLRILDSEVSEEIKPVLFVGADVPDGDLRPFYDITNCEIVVDPLFDERRRGTLILRSLIFGRDSSVFSLFNHNRIDLVFESALFLGWRLSFPAIAWVPDLQHRLLPQLFSFSARVRREFGFRAQKASGRTIMVSSEDSKTSWYCFYPSTKQEVRVVRFAISQPRFYTFDEARAVADRYGLPEHYFFMPNQFWVHKNHMLVVRAMKLLRDRGISITILASGERSDPRNSTHGPSVLDFIKRESLSANILTPGMIPYSDLLPLMQASAGLINPSLFEGWSTTVEEARAVGAPMVLSDLPVHKEQAGDSAIYFDRSSPESLAHVLSQFEPLSRTNRKVLSESSRADGSLRIKRFANEFCRLVTATVSRH